MKSVSFFINQLKSIGIVDSSYWRDYLTEQISLMFYNAERIAQDSGRFMTEWLLAGPNGGFLKLQVIWDGNRLITFFLFGEGR